MIWSTSDSGAGSSRMVRWPTDRSRLMPFVYILHSNKNGRFYIGSTIDIARRLNEHQVGKSRATRNLRPFKLVFKQEYDSIIEARRIERAIKKLKSRAVIERIIDDGIIRLKRE